MGGLSWKGSGRGTTRIGWRRVLSKKTTTTSSTSSSRGMSSSRRVRGRGEVVPGRKRKVVALAFLAQL
jgi:hypothetical protein